MYNVLVAGAGKIGSLIACLLVDSGDYNVHLADVDFNGSDSARLLKVLPQIKTVGLDAKDEEATAAYLKKHSIIAVISSLPYYLNPHIAKAAKLAGTHYFDLTEDISVTEAVKAIAKGAETAFVPQCGLSARVHQHCCQ